MADRPNDPKVPETLGACDYALRPWAALATFPQAFPHQDESAYGDYR